MGDIDLVDTPHWALSLHSDGALTFESGEITTELLDVDVEPGEPVRYEVVADPVVMQHFVRLDDAAAFLPAQVLEHDDPLDPGDRGAGDLCPLLTDRLG